MITRVPVAAPVGAVVHGRYAGRPVKLILNGNIIIF